MPAQKSLRADKREKRTTTAAKKQQQQKIEHGFVLLLGRAALHLTKGRSHETLISAGLCAHKQ